MVALTENRTGLPMEIHWTERIAPPPSIQAYHQAYRYNCMHGTKKLKNVWQRSFEIIVRFSCHRQK